MIAKMIILIVLMTKRLMLFPHNYFSRSVRTQLHIAVADKRPFNVKKVQNVHLDQLDKLDKLDKLDRSDKLDKAQTSNSTFKKGSDTPPIVIPSPKKGSNNTYSEYFDNLLSLIDKASKDLSL